jgi:hypothetical protein
MKIFALIILTFLLISCDNQIDFDKNYYERISGIKFPKKYSVIETCDNGEFATTTSFRIDSIMLQEFSKTNHFDTVKYPFYLFFMGSNSLKRQKPGLKNKATLLYVSGHSKKNTWLYIIDTKQKMLWVEIQYPDWGGHSPTE